MIIEWLQQVIQERGLIWICERFMEMKLIEEVLLDIGIEKILILVTLLLIRAFGFNMNTLLISKTKQFTC